MRRLSKIATILLLLLAGQVMAATCTSKASGNWNSSGTWNCTSGSTPASGDSVVLASPYTVSLNGGNRTVASLTINSGATLDDDGQDLRVNGNVVNNGTFGTNGGALIMRGVNSTLSGSGVFNDTDVQADASGISIPVGSTMAFENGAQLRVGRNNTGSFTLNGAIVGTGLASGDRIIRVYDGSSATINGTLNAPDAYIRVEQNATLTNNGSVTVQYLDSNGNNASAVWTQGNGATLTLSQTPAGVWQGTLNASATNNTVTFTGTAVAFSPQTYYNINVPAAQCPHPAGITALGTSSCGAAPAPIAEYRFDEATGGTVTDSSGNALSGTINGGVSVGGVGKVCGAYNFNGSSAYVSVPNNALLNQTKVTTMAWVRHGSAAMKNWEAILAKGDSAYRMHLNGGCSITTPNPAKALSFGINGGCATADVNSGTVPVANTWYHVVGTYDGSTIKIYINGALQQSAAYAGSINSNAFPFYIGDNSQNTGRFWSGDIDEVKIFSSALSASQIATGYANENAGKNWDGSARVCPAANPDHYELSLPTSSISCLTTPVTVTACANNSSPCTNAMTTMAGKTAILSTSAGALAATTVTFDAAGVASTTLAYPAATDGAVAVVTLSGEQAAAVNPRKACPDGANCVVANTSSSTFKTAGFIFAAAPDVAETTFASQTAGVSFGPYWLRSVKTNTTTKACEAAFTSPHPVTLSYQCLDPASCSSANFLSVGATSVSSAGTSVNLAFDANGNAGLGNFNFYDVGQIKINASATVGGAALTGSTKEAAGSHFVVKPYSLVLTDIKQTASPSLVNPAAADAAGNKFVKAGEDFSVTVTSVNASCAANLSGYTLLSSIPASCITPNFGKEQTPETVTLSHALVTGLGLTADPILGNAAVFGVFSGGSATAASLSWGEVGIITLTPGLTDANYLGAGNAVVTTSGNVGRFFPDHFDTVVTGPLACPTGLCASPVSTMAYSGQAFGVTVTARNAGGTTTQNYQGAFAKAVTLSAVASNGGTAIATTSPGGTLSANSVAATAFAAGVNTVTAASPVFDFAAALTAPTDVYIRAVDADAVSSLRSPAASSAEGGVKVVSGRLNIANGYGSELLSLPMRVTAQYYNGSAWVTSTKDGLSAPGGSVNVAAVTGATTCTGLGFATTPVAVTSGLGSFTLTKPTNGRCSADITLTAPTYLPSVSARATFGIYKSPLIYRRENY